MVVGALLTMEVTARAQEHDPDGGVMADAAITKSEGGEAGQPAKPDTDETLPPSEEPADAGAQVKHDQLTQGRAETALTQAKLAQDSLEDATLDVEATAKILHHEAERLELWDKYFIPWFQGGLAFGVSPEGSQHSQIGTTPTFAGFSGGVGDRVIAEYLWQLYLDKPDGVISLRDRYVGIRVPFDQITLRLRLGREDLGATYWSFLTGTIGDPRTLLRDGFGRSSESVIAGISIGRYAQIRGAFNEATRYRAISTNAHWGPVFFDIGYRTADDELGEISRAALGVKTSGLTVGVLCERHSELITKAQVNAGQKGALQNACVGQLGYAFNDRFTLIYTEGWNHIGEGAKLEDNSWYRNLHLDYQVSQIKGVSAIVFASCGLAKNVPNLFGMSNLVSPTRDEIYGVCETGVRIKVGRFFDPLWPF